MAKTLRIRLLGDVQILDGDMPLAAVDAPRLQSLLAYLMLHRGAAQSRSHLAYLFWPDSTEQQAHTNLRKQLYHLRHALPDPDRFLHSSHHTVQWLPDSPFSLDVADFQAAVARAEQAAAAGNLAARRTALEAVASLYGGDLMPACYEDWAIDERERLRLAFVRAIESLAGLLEERREYQAAIGYAQQLLRHDRLQEDTYRRLIRLYALAGDQARALRTYHACATMLRRELGVKPSLATQEVYQQVLVPSPPPHPPRVEPGPSPLEPASVIPLVGREEEWAELQAAWQAAARGHPQMALITGEAGIGKTHLAEEFLTWARSQGVPTVAARCYASESRLAYAPLVAWLRGMSLPELGPAWLSELARVLPEILEQHPGVPAPQPLTDSWQRQHLFAALAQPFLGHRQLVLLLDDMQWCDDETMEWLAHLLHAKAGAGSGRKPVQLLIAATLRVEDSPETGALLPLLQDLRRSGQAREIELAPLTRAQSHLLAEAVAGHELSPDQAAELYGQTEGNPLFVVETVRAGFPSPAVEERPRGRASEPSLVPPAVHAAISARLASLSPTARELAALAAIIGREFSFAILASASQSGEEELVSALDELWRRRIVRELGIEAYGFSHEKLRELVYAGLSAARRRLLHGRVAAAMDEVLAGNLETASGQIAWHYERAGLFDRALPHHRRAAAAAARIYDNDEAVCIYRHLLEGEPAAHMTPAETCEVLLDLARVWRLTARWVEAEAVCRRALKLAALLDDGHLVARSRRALADVLRHPGTYEEALAHLEAAQSGFEAAGDHQSLGAVLGTMGRIYWYQGASEHALETLQRQMRVAGETGNRLGMADAAATMGLVLWSQGHLEKAAARCRQAIDIAGEIGHRWAVGRAALTLGNIAADRHEEAAALAWYQQARQMAEEIGDRLGAVWAAAIAGSLHHRRGDSEGSLASDSYVLSLLEFSNAWEVIFRLFSLASAHARQGRHDHSEALMRQANALADGLDESYFRAYIDNLVDFYVRQELYREAQLLNDLVLDQASPDEGQDGALSDGTFRARVLAVQLRWELGQAGRDSCLAEIEAMLTVEKQADRQALLHHTTWQIDPSQEAHRQTAARLYRALYLQGSDRRDRDGFEQVTGEGLRPAPCLPEFPAGTRWGRRSSDDIVARVDRMIAELSREGD